MAPTGDCLDDPLLHALLSGEVSASAHGAAMAHLSGCSRCSLLVSELLRLSAASRPPAADAPVVARGDTLGRYVVLDRLGAGAMGVVHAAYDPVLDRKVCPPTPEPPEEGRVMSLETAKTLVRRVLSGEVTPKTH